MNISSSNIDAIIFDMDGVIVESEYRNYLAKLEVLKPYGISFDYDYYAQFPGNSNIFVWEKIITDFSLADSADFFHKKDLACRQRLIEKQGHIAIDGAVDLIKSLVGRYKLALASGSPEKIIIDALKSLNIFDCFSYIVSGENMPHCKPAPDIFLDAAAHLSIETERCAVIEDSHNGVLAAKAAKMHCVGFINKNSGEQDLSLADFTVNSHKQLAQFDWNF